MAGRPIDHVVVAVYDLNRMASELGELGFKVTERSDHPFGTSNRLVVLEACYIELVAITSPDLVPDTGFARFVADGLAAGRTGPMMVALRSDRPDLEIERLRSAGLSVSEPIRFGRWVDLPDGDRRYAEFVTVLPDFNSTVLTGFFCRHLTPELVWQPEVMTHPNGAARLIGLTLPDPGAEAWDRLALLASTEPASELTFGSVNVKAGGREVVVAGDTTVEADLGAVTISLRRRSW